MYDIDFMYFSVMADLESTTDVVPQHHRSKRGFFEGIEFQLKSPSKDWHKILGGEECGASFGLTIKNVLDLKIG